jgi:D-lyxose ketol-isomerase
MNPRVKALTPEADAQARAAYQMLYATALPGSGGIEADRIEVASFNCAETYAEFQQVGLGLETVVIFRDESGDGHTGKVLMNLPGQLLPEHGHVDTIVLKKGSAVAPGFIPLRKLVNGFTGIKTYNADATVATDANGNAVYRYRDSAYQIVQAVNGLDTWPDAHATDVVAIFPGKSETFKSVYGDGVLFADTARVLYAPPGIDPETVPETLLPMVETVRAEQAITTKRMLYMTRGMNVLLAKNTRHAFLAGPAGCVYLEFSAPSMDEADRFTDPRAIR